MAEGESSDTEGTPPVVLCCATSDEATARTAADALLGRGHEVELVIGVDAGHAELLAAIARLESQGLYVLCRSAAMPRTTIDELRAVLRSHEVPFGRTLTLAIEAKRPRALEERVVSVLRRMVTGRQDKVPQRRATQSFAGPEVRSAPPPSVSKSPSASLPPVARSTPPAAEMPVKSDATTRADAKLPPPPESAVDDTVDADEIAAWADSLIGDMPGDAPGDTPRSDAGAGKPERAAVTFSAPAPDYQPVMHTQVAQDEDLNPVRDGNTVKQAVLTPPTEAPPSVAPLPAMPPPTSSPAASPSVSAGSVPSISAPAAASAPVVGATTDDDLDGPSTVGGSMSRALGGPRGMMLVVGGGVVLIMVLVGLALVGGDDDDDNKKAATNKSAEQASKVAAADLTPESGQDKSKAAADDGDAPAADDGAAAAPNDAQGNGAQENDAQGDDAHRDGDDAADDGADAAAGDAAPADGGEIAAAISPPPREAPQVEHLKPPAEPPPPPTEPVARGAGDSAAVAEALRNREVRAFDLFIIAPEESEDMAHGSAMAFCEAMDIAGLSGWRMPKLGELNSIAGGGMVGKAIYWSDTLADAFGDTRLVFNGRKKRIGGVTVGFEDARVVCIRDRR